MGYVYFNTNERSYQGSIFCRYFGKCWKDAKQIISEFSEYSIQKLKIRTFEASTGTDLDPIGDNMNFMAGILIGLANDNWPAVLIAPFIWGVVRIIYILSFREDIIEAHKRDFRGKWISALFFVDYMAAIFMAFLLSVVTYSLKSLILWIL